MALYETLLDAYDALFPPNPATFAFVGPPPAPGAALADVGCATGGHAFGLAAAGWRVFGLDTAAPMLAAARAKAAASRAGVPDPSRPLPEFIEGGMLDVGRFFAPGSLSALLCLGNTLPHLRDRDEIRLFLGMAARALVPGGRLVVQVLNYARIMGAGIRALPELGAGPYAFRRSYRDRDDGRLDFMTELAVDGKVQRDSTPLYPVRPAELADLAERAGFGSPAMLAGWSGGGFDPASDQVLVLDARLPG